MLDTWYVQNWSLWHDIIIIFKTLPVVWKGDGAY
jgi:lipopolysaccharide/colanic/teichoic acid biosynthesis glycosyltransferase